MIIEINEDQEAILRDALEMWFSNESDDCHDAGRDDLSDEALEIGENIVGPLNAAPDHQPISIEEALREGMRIRGEKVKSSSIDEDDPDGDHLPQFGQVGKGIT